MKNGKPNKTQRNPKTSKTTKISKTAQAERITAMRSAALIASLQFFHRKRKIRTNLQLGRLRSDYSVLAKVGNFDRNTPLFTLVLYFSRSISQIFELYFIFLQSEFPVFSTPVQSRRRRSLHHGRHSDSYGEHLLLTQTPV